MMAVAEAGGNDYEDAGDQWIIWTAYDKMQDVQKGLEGLQGIEVKGFRALWFQPPQLTSLFLMQRRFSACRGSTSSMTFKSGTMNIAAGLLLSRRVNTLVRDAPRHERGLDMVRDRYDASETCDARCATPSARHARCPARVTKCDARCFDLRSATTGAQASRWRRWRGTKIKLSRTPVSG